jgi:hypothetical protein
MNEREEAFEVAKLAAMVGGQMKMVDKMTIERTTNQANRININDFINKVKNPNASYPVNLPQTPQGFAPPLSEAYIHSVIPDAQPSYNPEVLQNQNILPQVETIPLATVSNIPLKLHPEPKETKTVIAKNETTVLTRSDVDSIRNSLKSIDKTLAGMLKFLQENSKPKANE